MKKVFTAIALLVCMFTNAQEVSIIPQPTSLTKKDGSFDISAKTTLQIKSAGQQKAANFFNKYLQEFYGFQLKVTVGNGLMVATTGLTLEQLFPSVPLI